MTETSPTTTAKPRPVPNRKPSVTFRDDCVFIDDHPLSTTENGIQRKVSLPGQSGLPTLTKKRLSLSILPSPPKFRLPRKWSNGPVSATYLQIPPRISTQDISAPISLPSTPISSSAEEVFLKRIKGEMDVREAPMDVGAKMGEVQAGELFASQSGSTLAPSCSMDMPALDTPRSVNIADDDNVRVGTVQTSRPTLHIAPDYSPVVPVPRRSATLPLATSSSSLDILHENEDASNRPKKETAVISPRSCQAIWLCSQPRSPISPTSQSPFASHIPAHQTIRSISASPNTAPSSYVTAGKKSRPFVIRSLSTGRLAHEFDEEGRVICLSSHSERIITANQVNDASPIRPGALRSNSNRGTGSSPILGPPVSRTPSLLERLGSPIKEEQGLSNKERKGYTVMNT